MSAAINASYGALDGGLRHVAFDHVVEPRGRLAGVLGLDLDPRDVGLLALLERGAGGSGRAAEVQHAAGRVGHVVEDLGPGPLIGRGAGRSLSRTHAAERTATPDHTVRRFAIRKGDT